MFPDYLFVSYDYDFWDIFLFFSNQHEPYPPLFSWCNLQIKSKQCFFFVKETFKLGVITYWKNITLLYLISWRLITIKYKLWEWKFLLKTMTGRVIVSGEHLLITTLVPNICPYSDSIIDLHATSETSMFLKEGCFLQAV